MSFKRIELGKRGENCAINILKGQGYRILEKNYKIPLGEIDIIALDGDAVCFIEVKTRMNDDFGSPLESITKSKQKKLTKVALSYLKSKNWLEKDSRFDVVSVFKNDNGELCAEILKDAFDSYGNYAY